MVSEFFNKILTKEIEYIEKESHVLSCFLFFKVN